MSYEQYLIFSLYASDARKENTFVRRAASGPIGTGCIGAAGSNEGLPGELLLGLGIRNVLF